MDANTSPWGKLTLQTLSPDHDPLTDESYPWYRVAAGCEESRNENDALIEKENIIFQCLNGTDEAVDLWHLRDLALSRGGLVNSSIRKRAWPKLLGAHEQLFQSNRDTLVDISNTSMQLLMKDVLLSVWAIEDLIKLNRQHEEYRLSKMRPRKVSFVPDLMESTSAESDGPSPVKSIDLVYTEAEKDNDNDHYSNGTYSPITVHTYDVSSEISTTSFTCKRMASKTEQKLLFNIITTVLRMPPAENPYFEDDTYKYYSGLSDVAALLLINLESPSLVSLVMGQLARWHLRDSMRRNNIYIESTIHISLYPLLCTIDRELHSHITSCLSTPSFCLSWVQGWFCQCFRDVYVVSRLFDVFIVSHALMPIYFCVAFLSHPINRTKIMSTNCNKRDMYNCLRLLPMRMMKCSPYSVVIMDLIEEILQIAISLITKSPPNDLMQISSSNLDLDAHSLKLHGIEMLKPPPPFFQSSTAPTDYAVLLNIKAMRNSDDPSLNIEPRMAKEPTHYPRAEAALGIKHLQGESRHNKMVDIRQLPTTNFPVTLLFVICTLACSLINQKSSGVAVRWITGTDYYGTLNIEKPFSGFKKNGTITLATASNTSESKFSNTSDSNPSRNVINFVLGSFDSGSSIMDCSTLLGNERETHLESLILVKDLQSNSNLSQRQLPGVQNAGELAQCPSFLRKGNLSLQHGTKGMSTISTLISHISDVPTDHQAYFSDGSFLVDVLKPGNLKTNRNDQFIHKCKTGNALPVCTETSEIQNGLSVNAITTTKCDVKNTSNESYMIFPNHFSQVSMGLSLRNCTRTLSIKRESYNTKHSHTKTQTGNFLMISESSKEIKLPSVVFRPKSSSAFSNYSYIHQSIGSLYFTSQLELKENVSSLQRSLHTSIKETSASKACSSLSKPAIVSCHMHSLAFESQLETKNDGGDLNSLDDVYSMKNPSIDSIFDNSSEIFMQIFGCEVETKNAGDSYGDKMIAHGIRNTTRIGKNIRDEYVHARMQSMPTEKFEDFIMLPKLTLGGLPDALSVCLEPTNVFPMQKNAYPNRFGTLPPPGTEKSIHLQYRKLQHRSVVLVIKQIICRALRNVLKLTIPLDFIQLAHHKWEKLMPRISSFFRSFRKRDER